MSRLQSAADYERAQAELESLIRQQEAVSDQLGDFASRIGVASLRQRLEALQSELAELRDEQMAGHEIDVIFNGKPVSWNMLDADFIGNILVKIQGLVRTMVASDRGHERDKGRFPKRVRDLSRLHFAGSFRMRLEAFQDQAELDGFIPLSPTFAALMALLEVGDDPDMLLGQLAEHSNRTKTQYE